MVSDKDATTCLSKLSKIAVHLRFPTREPIPNDRFRSPGSGHFASLVSEFGADRVLCRFCSQVLCGTCVAFTSEENVSGVACPCQPSARFFSARVFWVTHCLSCGDPVGLRTFTPCGEEGTRTPDLLLAKQALYQLSYSPDRVPPTVCAYLDSNQGPQLYQSCALAN